VSDPYTDMIDKEIFQLKKDVRWQKAKADRFARALINIRDYDIPHCRGDYGCQHDCEIENIEEQIMAVDDILEGYGGEA